MSNNEPLNLMPKTKTAWDEENYMDILESTIIQSNCVSRTGDKPMAALSEKFDTHLSFRLLHEVAAASIIKRLAKGLGLNERLASVGMMIHDVGHPFSAHDGEEIFTTIGKLYNCGYFHHNAKGVETIRAENILNTALGMIPDIKYRHDLRRNLTKDFNYILDIVISHDGEADPNDLDKMPTQYDNIEEAVEDKLRKSNTENNYKFVAQTPEGMLAKYADVIAYLSSDVRDGFRLGILKNFNDKFLELFGRVVSDNRKDIEYDENGKKIAIEIAKGKIAEIQEKYLEELTEDVKHEKNASILSVVRNIKNEIDENKINTYMLSKYYDENEYDEKDNNDKNIEEKIVEYEKEKEKIEEQINKILQKNLESFVNEKGEIGPEQVETVKAEIIKIKQYVDGMLYVNTRVVNEVTSIIQEYFIDDLVKNTKRIVNDTKKQIDNGTIDEKEVVCVPLLSNDAAKIFKNARNYGYTFYVPLTKTRYQKDLLPENVRKIIEYCAKNLIGDGIIQRKLKDETIRSKIPKEILKYADEQISTKPIDAKKEIIGFIENTKIKQRYELAQKNKKSKFIIIKKLKNNINKQGTRFAKTYEYTYQAMENQIRDKVEKALGENYKFNSSKTDVLEKMLEEEIQIIRNNILDNYPNMEKNSISKEEKENIIQELLEVQRKKIIEKMAVQLSIDYVSGMTDEGIKDLAIDLGYMTQEEYEKAQNERGGELTETLKNLQKMTSDNPRNEDKEI